MKILGWILVIISGLNLITSIATFSTGVEVIGAEKVFQRIGTAIGLLILGIYLLNRASKKAEASASLDNWKSNN